MHYLDCAATTAVAKPVADAVYDAMLRFYANPSSLYGPGLQAEQAITGARGALAAALGCLPGEVVFTGSGTEANNIALLGEARARKAWGNHIVATGYEHPSVANTLAMMARQEGFELTLVNPGPGGVVDADALVQAVGPKTVLLTAMQVNNETGAVLDVAALAAGAKRKNHRTAVHVDGVQAFTRLPLRLADTQIDSYAVSGHKLHAPKGVGALYVRRGLHMLPVMGGGGQEKALRPGTENTAYIVGFGQAVQLAMQHRAAHAVTVAALNQRLRAGLAAMPQAAVHSPESAWPGTLSLSLPGYKSETLLHFLEQRQVYVSSGSACAKGEPSHTLTAMGLSPRHIDGALRVSFDGESTGADIDALLAALREGLAALAH